MIFSKIKNKLIYVSLNIYKKKLNRFKIFRHFGEFLIEHNIIKLSDVKYIKSFFTDNNQNSDRLNKINQNFSLVSEETFDFPNYHLSKPLNIKIDSSLFLSPKINLLIQVFALNICQVDLIQH